MMWRLFGQFMRLFYQPSLAAVQFYLLIFIGISFLSFATFLRDFYSLPILLVQLLSPALIPILLYIMPASLISAGIFSWWAHYRRPRADAEAAQKQLRKMLTTINIALPLILSLVYLLLYLRIIRGGFELGNFGLIFGLLSIPSVMGGASLGQYTRTVSHAVLMDAPPYEKEKRTLTHALEDNITDDDKHDLDDAETINTSQQQSHH